MKIFSIIHKTQSRSAVAPFDGDSASYVFMAAATFRRSSPRHAISPGGQSCRRLLHDGNYSMQKSYKSSITDAVFCSIRVERLLQIYQSDWRGVLQRVRENYGKPTSWLFIGAMPPKQWFPTLVPLIQLKIPKLSYL